jgi:muramoyltetrapeptide carboxypeptidase
MDRRKFISSASIAGIAGLTALNAKPYEDLQDKIFAQNNSSSASECIIPKALEKGDRIAITAPATHASIWSIRHAINYFKKLGLKVDIGDTVKNHESKYHYLSASDGQRTDEFMTFIERDDVKAIVSARGGYGTMRILPDLDYTMIKKHPKIIMGFSDITAMLIAITIKSQLVTYHGPVAASTFNSFTDRYLKYALIKDYSSKNILYTSPALVTMSPGSASGKLVGGNLAMVAATIGTPYEIETRNSIFFFEDVSEEPYQLDRILTQLLLAGKLQQCSGILIGPFKRLNKRYNFFPGSSYTIKQVLENRLKPLGIPILYGFPIGHREDKMTIPLGIPAEMDADKKTFRTLTPSVNSL